MDTCCSYSVWGSEVCARALPFFGLFRYNDFGDAVFRDSAVLLLGLIFFFCGYVNSS